MTVAAFAEEIVEALCSLTMNGRAKRSAMDECHVCNHEIKAEDRNVKCLFCSNSLHMKCAGLSDSRYNKVQKNNSYYCSTQCETTHSTNRKMDELLASMKTLQVSVDKVDEKCEMNIVNQKKTDDMIGKLTTSLRELTKTQNDMKVSVEEVKSSQDFISAQYDDIKSFYEQMKVEFTTYSSKMSDHDNQLVNLKTSLCDVQKRLRIAEQAALRNEIMINGVPKSLALSETIIVTKIAAAVGVQLYTPDIERIRRARNGMIHVEFNNSKVRNDILQARKGKSLYLDEIDFGSSLATAGPSRVSPTTNKKNHTQIYINENLTRETRIIFREAKSLRSSHGYKYVWCNKGVVYCKREDSSEVHIIDTVEDVNKLRSGSPKKV